MNLYRKYKDWKESKWKEKFNYENNSKIVDIGWKIVNTHGIITVPLQILRASIRRENGRKRLLRIEQTPHYKWIKDLLHDRDDTASRKQYANYLKCYMANADIEQSIDNVKSMVFFYKSNPKKVQSITIITHHPRQKLHIGPFIVKIYDGVHRSSIAKVLGHKLIRCRLK